MLVLSIWGHTWICQQRLCLQPRRRAAVLWRRGELNLYLILECSMRKWNCDLGHKCCTFHFISFWSFLDCSSATASHLILTECYFAYIQHSQSASSYRCVLRLIALLDIALCACLSFEFPLEEIPGKNFNVYPRSRPTVCPYKGQFWLLRPFLYPLQYLFLSDFSYIIASILFYLMLVELLCKLVISNRIINK